MPARRRTNLDSTIVLPANTPTPFGIVGLDVTGASGVIRVQFSGIAKLLFPDGTVPLETVMSIGIVRGTTPADQLVTYKLYGNGNAIVSPVQTLTITASDYNVPYPPPNSGLIYTIFVFSTVTATRIGVESFNAAAYCD